MKQAIKFFADRAALISDLEARLAAAPQGAPKRFAISDLLETFRADETLMAGSLGGTIAFVAQHSN